MAAGLRISEALGLTGKAHPLPEVLRITGKGGKERLVPTLPAARAAVARYAALCPHDLTAPEPLFRGTRGGALNPRLIAAAMERPGCSWACPPPPRPMRCATALPRICCLRAAICARFRNCWAMPRCPPRRPIPPWMPRA
jgi:hypothetical protein